MKRKCLFSGGAPGPGLMIERTGKPAPAQDIASHFSIFLYSRYTAIHKTRHIRRETMRERERGGGINMKG